MDNYSIFCYENDNMDKIYRFIDNVPFNSSNNGDLIIVCQTSSPIIDNIITCVNDLLDDCLEYKQFNKIILMSFNSIIKYVEINKDNYLNDYNLVKNFLTIHGGLDYNSLNNTLLDLVINFSKCTILFFMNGCNPYNQNIIESLTMLSSFTRTIDCSVQILTFADNVNKPIIDKYKQLVLSDSKFKCGELKNDSDIDNLIFDIVTNIRYLDLFGQKIKLKLENNIYSFDVFDFENRINLKNKSMDLTMYQQLDSLYYTIYHCYNVDYNRLNILYKIIKKVVERYKKVVQNNEKYYAIIGRIDDAVNDIFRQLYKLSKEQLHSKFSSYFDKSSHVIMSSKHKLKFHEIVHQNICEMKDIDKNIEKIFASCEFKKFVNKFNPANNQDKCDNEKNRFTKSLEIYYSALSITDWFEEMTSKGIMGIMIRVASPNIAKIGYNLNSVEIKDITTTLTPLQNILDAADFYYNKHNKLDFGSDCEPMISGNAVGTGNAILPLYICKEHWKLAKLYLKPTLGIMLCQNPVSYNKKHIPFVFTLFLDMVTRTFKNNKNKKWIQLLFGVFRTCVEISKDNNFNKGIVNIYKKYMANPLNRTKNIIHSTYSILGQLLVTHININNLDKFMKYVFEEKIRRRLYTFLPKNITIMNFLDIKNDSIVFDETKLNNLYNKFKLKANNIYENIDSFHKFHTLVQKFSKKYNHFNNFIHELDRNYSLINDLDMQTCQTFVKENINYNINEEFYKKCVLQGLEQKNNKIRCNLIKQGYYTDPTKISFNDLSNSIIKRYNNDKKIMITVNCVKNNNVLIVTEDNDVI